MRSRQNFLWATLAVLLALSYELPLLASQKDCVTVLKGLQDRVEVLEVDFADATLHSSIRRFIGENEPIFVFGDVHGNIRSLFKDIRDRQILLGRRISLAIGVGDLEFFPWDGRSDGIHKRDAFRAFMDDPSLYNEFFRDAEGLDKLDLKIVTTRGNHEDYAALSYQASSSPTSIAPLDPYGVFHFLKDGESLIFKSQDKKGYRYFRISGLGGIDPKTRPGFSARNPDVEFDQAAIDRLLDKGGAFSDILITHQGPTTAVDGSGEINSLIELTRPTLHVHGHGHTYVPPYAYKDTVSVSMGRYWGVKGERSENFGKSDRSFIMTCRSDASIGIVCSPKNPE